MKSVDNYVVSTSNREYDDVDDDDDDDNEDDEKCQEGRTIQKKKNAGIREWLYDDYMMTIRKKNEE